MNIKRNTLFIVFLPCALWLYVMAYDKICTILLFMNRVLCAQPSAIFRRNPHVTFRDNGPSRRLERIAIPLLNNN